MSSNILVFLQMLNLAIISISVLLLYLQIKKNHEWNRRKASQDLLFQLVKGELLDIRKKLEQECGLRLYDEQQNYSNFVAKCEDPTKEDIKFYLKSLFNYFEAMAVGIKDKVLDEEMCYDYVSVILVNFVRWGEDYIKEMQKFSPTMWIEVSHYAEKWKKRLHQATELLRRPGKKAT